MTHPLHPQLTSRQIAPPSSCPWWAGTSRASSSARASPCLSRPFSVATPTTGSSKPSAPTLSRSMIIPVTIIKTLRGVASRPQPSPPGALVRRCLGDVGDGWHSTYAIAYALAQEKLHITKATNGGHYNITIPRQVLLIFGGDEVYPTASQEAYEQRLVGPYATALRKTEASASPHIFAIPGNHDWYDSLASFIRLFTSRRWFGGWRTRQTGSYFALRLPQQWWLLGTDVQLGSDIDRPQVQYFERRGPGDRPARPGRPASSSVTPNRTGCTSRCTRA